MDRQPDNSDQVRRLLMLKRHEMPPPGYFEGFSVQVVARIRAGETGEEPTFFQRLTAEPLWFQRLLAALDAKPAFAGAFGLVVCGILVAGVFYSERSDGPTAAVLPPVEAMPGALRLAGWASGAVSESSDRLAGVQFAQTNSPTLQHSIFNDIQRYRQAETMPIDYQQPARQQF